MYVGDNMRVPVCVCVCVCMCMYVCLYVYVCLCISECCICLYICICGGAHSNIFISLRHIMKLVDRIRTTIKKATLNIQYSWG